MEEKWMKKCLELALSADAAVKSNPKVGCVIVHNGKIIGQGNHEYFGGPHAEVNAINSVQDQSLLSKSTLYVNLEPCSHTGKTPPCSDLIIRKKIPQVVIGTLDSNPLVSGAGVKKMEDAGIKVELSNLKKECLDANKIFFHYQENKRAYITIKFAQSKDGFIYSPGKAQKLSNQCSDIKVHLMRANHQCILIGKTTLLNDNPSLTTRLTKGPSPLPIVLCKVLTQEMLEKKVLTSDRPALVFYQSMEQDLSIPENSVVEFVSYDQKEFFTQFHQELIERGLISVLVEGGSEIISLFINNGQWNELHQIICNVNWNAGTQAPALDNLKPTGESSEECDGDLWHSFFKEA